MPGSGRPACGGRPVRLWLGGQGGPHVAADGGRHGGPVGLHPVQLRHPFDGPGRGRLLVPVCRRGRVDGDHRPGHGAPELRHGLLRRPAQHPGLHRGGGVVVELPDRRDQVGGLQVDDVTGLQRRQRRRQPAAQRGRHPGPLTRGRRGQPQRRTDLVPGLLLRQPPPLGGVRDRAQRPLLHAVQHRPAPLPGPDQIDPVGVVQHLRVDVGQQRHHRQVGAGLAVGDRATNCPQPPDSARITVPSSCTAIPVVMPET